MCSPTAAYYAFTIGATLLSARSQRQSAKFNSAVARNNAILRDRAAADTEQRGRTEADRRRIQAQQEGGTQRAALAAQGVDLASGTALDFAEGTAELGELDALTIENNAAREAFGLRVGAMDARAESRLSRHRSRTQPMATLLTGGAKAAGGAQRFGLFSGDTED